MFGMYVYLCVFDFSGAFDAHSNPVKVNVLSHTHNERQVIEQ